MIVVGLTGSIGMGKSTAAKMFSDAGIAVYSADDVVHQLYTGKAVAPVGEAFAGVVENGKINRDKLAKLVLGNEQAMKRLEAIVHPLVQEEERQFRLQAQQNNAPFILLDIPLLFETGKQDQVDYSIVVSAPYEIQRQRVLARAGMTEEKFQQILARQMPDALKRERADFIINSGVSLDEMQAQISGLIEELNRKSRHA